MMKLTIRQFVVLHELWLAECAMSALDMSRTMPRATTEQCYDVLEELVKMGAVTYTHRGYELALSQAQVNEIAGVWS